MTPKQKSAASANAMSPTDYEKRARLVELLRFAGQVEHAVMCQYIFAAVSMKKDHDEGGVSWADLENMRVWRAHIMTVAREEMEHLGLVLNLLTAVGEAPTLGRRPFPFDIEFGGLRDRLSLEPFSVDTVRTFALIEMPRRLSENSPGWALLSRGDPTFNPEDYDLIARLYDEIERLIEDIPHESLILGPPDAQFTTHDIFPGSIRGISLKGAPAYNVSLHAVTNTATAIAAVKQIKEEGEGAHEEGGPGSHFAIFIDVLAGLEKAARRADFQPARPVVSNPTLAPGPGQITHPITTRVMALFDACYQTLLLALTRYFAHTDESEKDLEALQAASFFPMMTTIIRPLAECLTLLPATPTGESRAGPSFVLPPNIDFLPHRNAAFKVLELRYEHMVSLAKALSDEATGKDPPPELAPMADRITQVYETLWRSLYNLKHDPDLEGLDA